jgi:phage recombination protein Bet
MTMAIAIREPQPIAGWESKLDLIKREIAKGASDDELEIFLHQCRKTGLDPLAKQIYFQKRGGKMTIITGIDGYRLVADRTGHYAGNDDPIFDDDAKPTKATVTVYKIVGGVRCAFTASARWSQYFPGDALGFMWKKMPHLMLGKCAEALALRKAFPAELSGVYTAEEMEQADSGKSEVQRQAEAKLICADCDKDIDAYKFIGPNNEEKFVTLEAIREANKRDFPDVNLCAKCQIERHSKQRKGLTFEQEAGASIVAVEDKKQRIDVLAEEAKVDQALAILIDDDEGRAQGIINQVLPKKGGKPFMLRIESATNPALKYSFGSFHDSHQDQLMGHEGQPVVLWYDVTKKNNLTYRNIKEIESIDGKEVTKPEGPF